MNLKSTSAFGILISIQLAATLGCSTPSSTHDPAAHSGSALDSSELKVSHISKTSPIHVHLFSTEGADLGNPDFKDITEAATKAAPHLLAADIVQTLREAGFEQVTLDETEGGSTPGTLNLTGRFTALNPGSQNLRLWIGFGAGRSKVAIAGELTDDEGNVLGTFTHDAKGIGWNESGAQLDTGAHSIGRKVGLFLAEWAE